MFDGIADRIDRLEAELKASREESAQRHEEIQNLLSENDKLLTLLEQEQDRRRFIEAAHKVFLEHGELLRRLAD